MSLKNHPKLVQVFLNGESIAKLSPKHTYDLAQEIFERWHKANLFHKVVSFEMEWYGWKVTVEKSPRKAYYG